MPSQARQARGTTAEGGESWGNSLAEGAKYLRPAYLPVSQGSRGPGGETNAPTNAEAASPRRKPLLRSTGSTSILPSRLELLETCTHFLVGIASPIDLSWRALPASIAAVLVLVTTMRYRTRQATLPRDSSTQPAGGLAESARRLERTLACAAKKAEDRARGRKAAGLPACRVLVFL